jgi:hypothetical protein
MDYVALKTVVASLVTPANADALAHVHGGMAVLLLARLVSRRSLATLVPLISVAALQLINECIDRYNHGSWRWPDTIADTVNTLFWPTVLFVGLRWRRERAR